METAETAETATEPKTIPPAVFKNGREVKKEIFRGGGVGRRGEDIKKKGIEAEKGGDIKNAAYSCICYKV